MYRCGKDWKNSCNENAYPKNYSNNKSNCPCSKINQSKCDGEIKGERISKTHEEYQKFLKSVYGICRRIEKPCKRKDANTSDVILVSSPGHRDNSFGARTEPNLSNAKYVDNLKKEIKAKKGEIPNLPDKYKDKYVKALKDELLLNKLTKGQDKKQQIKEIKKELKEYRSRNTSIARGDFPSTKSIEFQTEVYKGCNKKRKSFSEAGSTKSDRKKEKKGRKSKSSDRYDREHKHKKLLHEKHRSSSRKHKKSTQSLPTVEGTRNSKQLKNSSTVSIQCDLRYHQNEDNEVNNEIVKKLDAIQSVFPQIPLAIAQTQKNLEKTFRDAVTPLIVVPERGSSPVKDSSETQQQKKISEDATYSIPGTPHNTPTKEEEDTEDSGSSLPNPKTGDLLLNIQNIKEGRNLIDGFQNEYNMLKKDIQNCGVCKKGDKTNGVENLCEKHVVYIPILKVGEEGSKGDQMSLYSALRTEAYLKKKLDDQIQYIKQQERRLAAARRENNHGKIEAVQKELEVSRSYYDNLLVKQQNERLLNELQKTMREKSKHQCDNFEKCNKCCLQRQIFELLKRVRAHIAREIEDTRKRLQVQKMPPIDIRKPLEIQNILNMDIPPSVCDPACGRSNLNYETVIKDDGVQNEQLDGVTQKSLALDKTTAVDFLPSEVEKPGCDDQTCEERGVVIERSPCFITPRCRDNLSRQLPSEGEKSRCDDQTCKERGVVIERSPCFITPGCRENLSGQLTAQKMGNLKGMFTRSTETQCDSNSSLMEDAAISQYTQTFLGNDDSFLFGFKEYLLRNAKGRRESPDLADANFQVDMEDKVEFLSERNSITMTIESILKSKEGSFESTPQKFTDNVSVSGAKRRPPKRKIKKNLAKDLSLVIEDREAYLREKARLIRNELRKSPSVRKMIIVTDETMPGRPTPIEESIVNPNAQPRYKLKPISLINLETYSDYDEEDEHTGGGDTFYKSLTDVREAEVLRDPPERKCSSPTDSVKLLQLINEEIINEEKNEAEAIDHVKRIFLIDEAEKMSYDDTMAPEEILAKKETIESGNSEHPLGGTPKEAANDHDLPPIQRPEMSSDDSMEVLKPALSSKDPKNFLPSQQYVLDLEDNAIAQDQEKAEKDISQEMDIPTYNVIDETKEEQTKAVNEEQTKSTTLEKKVKMEDEVEESESLDKLPEKTVLSLLSPNVKVVLERNEIFKNKYKDKDELLKIPMVDNADLRVFESSPAHTPKSDFQKRISNILENNKFLIEDNRKNPDVTKYIIPKPCSHAGACFKFKSDVPRLLGERSDYAKKCSEFDKSIDSSSMVSSEGEVKCKNISKGEICIRPKRKYTDANRGPGIYYKEKVSSHIVLERERKHYQHWVTYYTTKKNENESCSSSEKSDTVNGD